MFDIGSGELLLILIAVLVFFGPKKMPELARSVGRGVREFKRAQQEFTQQINQAFSEEEGRQRGNVPRTTTTRVTPPPVELHGDPATALELPFVSDEPAPEPLAPEPHASDSDRTNRPPDVSTTDEKSMPEPSEPAMSHPYDPVTMNVGDVPPTDEPSSVLEHPSGIAQIQGDEPAVENHDSTPDEVDSTPAHSVPRSPNRRTRENREI